MEWAQLGFGLGEILPGVSMSPETNFLQTKQDTRAISLSSKHYILQDEGDNPDVPSRYQWAGTRNNFQRLPISPIISSDHPELKNSLDILG